MPTTATSNYLASEFNTVCYHSHARFHSEANYSIASSTWTALGNIATDFISRFGYNIRVDVSLQCSSSVAGDRIEVGVSFDNVATSPTVVAKFQQSVINVYNTVSGIQQVNGIATGSYSALLCWRRAAGTGTTIVPASGLPIMFRLREMV